MNVAWIVGFPVFGGPHNHVLRITQPLRDAGVEVTAVVPDGSSSGQRLRDAGVPVLESPFHRPRATRAWRPHYELLRYLRSDVVALRANLRKADIDVVVQATLLPPHGAIAGFFEDIPIVWQVVDTRVPAAVRVPAMCLLRATADVAMFCGEALRELYTQGTPLTCPVEVFYPPVDTERFQPSADVRAAVRREQGIPADARVVGMVANINPMKGWEYFIRAAGRLYGDRPDLHFLMVGAIYDEHRAYVERLKRVMAETRVPRDRFKLTGERRDVHRLLTAMDVQLITSLPRSEGAPTSALEGMACGVPIVGVDVAAVSEIIGDQVSGFVVPPLDVSAIADFTAKLLDDSVLRTRLGRAARALAVARHDHRASAALHVDAFDRAIAHHSASAHCRSSRTMAGAARLSRP